MSAFANDASTKAKVLADLGDNPATILAPTQSQDDLVAWAEEHALSPAFWLLACNLSKDDERFTPAVVADILAAVPIGADLDHAVYRWILWVLRPIVGRWNAVEAHAVLAQAAAPLMTVLERAAQGETIVRRDWRAALGPLADAAAAFEDQFAYASVIQAAAWDLKMMPAAILDVLSSWDWATSVDPELRTSWWSAEFQHELQKLMEDEHAAALESAGPQPSKEDGEAMAVWQKRYGDAIMPLREKNKTLPVMLKMEAGMKIMREQKAERLGRAVEALKDFAIRAAADTVDA
ncbi:hypothetical protein PX699_11265 [Sphingobium sp. H39-3-25]|uniref:hypothetical protein n=1 Tax=Sphingobium arseniciresistens TaxID=3030834 RepID=UPI0023B96B8D|nr:hypothetical protein [Sphingobium arseniciresistens]